METKVNISKINVLKLIKGLAAGQFIELYKTNARNLRDLLLVGVSIVFFSCTLYYAIVTSKNISSQATEYKQVSPNVKNQN